MFRKPFFLLFVVLVLSLLTAVTNADLAAYYAFDGDANDSSGNGLHGSLCGGAGFDQGEFGSAVDLDGNGDYVDCGNDSSLNPTGAITVAAWIYPTSYGTDSAEVAAKLDTQNNQRAYALRLDTASHKLQMFISIDGSLNSKTTISGSTIPLNEWTHVAGVYNGSSIKVYVDGVEDGSEPYSSGINSCTAPLYVGALLINGSPTRFFDGLIDEVGIYDGALLESEIEDIMDNGISGEVCIARNPIPGTHTTFVNLAPTLSWTAGNYAADVNGHDVYFGTDQSTVSDANTSSQQYKGRQTAVSFEPGTLELGTTYYWRIDEVNELEEPNSPWKGNIWRFTTTNKRILAHYVPWYQTESYSGEYGWGWDHDCGGITPPYSIASHFYPLLGVYDESDPHTAATQALLMKFAGCDGINVNWYGTKAFWNFDFNEEVTRNIFEYIKRAGLKFTLMNEDAIYQYMLEHPTQSGIWDHDQALAQAKTDMFYVDGYYFSDPCYLRIGGKPALLCFGPRAEWPEGGTALFDYDDWDYLLNEDMNHTPHFFPLRNHGCHYHWDGEDPDYIYCPFTGEFGMIEPAAPNGANDVPYFLNYFYDKAERLGWDYFVSMAEPQFHDYWNDCNGQDHDSAGYTAEWIAAEFIPDSEVDELTYSYTLRTSLTSDADIVLIFTWNDWGEGTQIEPSVEDGYLWLEMTQQMRKDYINSSFPYVPDDLRLPVRLYQLRKENEYDPSVMAKLQMVEDLLFDNDLVNAKMLLDQLECDQPNSGDLNGDCEVNLDDFSVFALAWLSSPGEENWNPVTNIAQPADSIIDIFDYAVFADNWLAAPVTGTSPKLQVGVVNNVSTAAWTTVQLNNEYTSMVVTATPNYDKSEPPVVVRIRRAFGDSFDVCLQAAGPDEPNSCDVHYMVVEKGVYTTAENGVKMEAVKLLSRFADHDSSWIGEGRIYKNIYTNPVVFGQVMTCNDPNFSTFWCCGSSRMDPPGSSNLKVGKTVCEDPNTTRASEIIGYIVIEAGSGTIDDVNYVAVLGGDTVGGVGDSPPYVYSLSGPLSPSVAVATQAGMDGSNGGWTLLYGTNPVTVSQLNLAIDEDRFIDTERSHVTEQVGYILFAPTQ